MHSYVATAIKIRFHFQFLRLPDAAFGGLIGWLFNWKCKFSCRIMSNIANYLKYNYFWDGEGIDNVTLRLWKFSDFCSRHTVDVAGDDIMFHILVFPQIITLIFTLLCFCFCYVLIEVIFAPDFATVTLVLLASNHLCYSLSETIFILVINAVQTVATVDKCDICSRKFQSHSHQIQCCVCLNDYHMKCISFRPEDLQKLTNERN